MREYGDGVEFEKAFRTTPEQAAKTILRAVVRNRRRVMVGTDAHILDWIVRLFPAHYQRLAIRNALQGAN